MILGLQPIAHLHGQEGCRVWLTADNEPRCHEHSGMCLRERGFQGWLQRRLLGAWKSGRGAISGTYKPVGGRWGLTEAVSGTDRHPKEGWGMTLPSIWTQAWP